MTAERRCAAPLDGAHHFQLREADVTAVGMTPSGAVIAENIRDLQLWPGMLAAYAALGLLLFGRFCVPPVRPSGLRIAAIRPVAMRV